ncbi:SsrA-binding protein SmpB [Mesomycoplasma bovoculi]|uniref:SsrA-binding protein n=1 Tax=Mesomycoplasma bovoculi M165/69 TaxID=743966 RepID=W5UT44_9BACT|nr:SsrA-binding protein SmpB [Mesomycoplasma bovoculi]AHH45384.1 SsrA-binding protein [Mesomycoplasma bovoculi M165/69]
MKQIAKNKVANYDYQIDWQLTAGVSLLGWEVKSIRAGNVNLKSSFCYFKDGELFVSNIHVGQYMNVPGDLTRSRKLLLTKAELRKLFSLKEKERISIIPQIIGWQNGKIKIVLGIGKGKTKYDKRQTIKERDQKRKIDSFLKNY